MNNFTLTSEQKLEFNKNGFIGPFTLYSSEEMKRMYSEIRIKLLDRENSPYDAPINSAILNYDRHLDIDLLSQHIFKREIVERLHDILGPDILCWRSEFIPKYPGDEGTDWHQADTFGHASGEPQLVWPENEEFGGTINVWMGITDATEENGCMQFIPGSHTTMNYDESKGMKFDPVNNHNVVKGKYARGFNGYDYSSLQKDETWTPDETKAKSISMKAGQFVIFRSMLMHCSLPNSTSDQTRMGYVARYVPGKVKVYPNTKYVKEFGGEYSLERFGLVQVSGLHSDPDNIVMPESLNGLDFSNMVIHF